VAVGGTAAFSAGVSGGTPPLTYQWQFDGTNIANATTTQLTLTNVQMTNAGSYTEVATDSLGRSATSSTALLVVGTVGHTLVGLWQFNQGTGTNFYDSSGNGLTGYLTNNSGSGTMPLWSANGSLLGTVASPNYSLYFPASQFNNSAQVNDTPLLDPTKAVTLAVDYNADGLGGQGVFVSKHAGGTAGAYLLGVENLIGGFYFMIINASGSRVNLVWPVPAGEAGSWHQLIGTYDGAMMRLYHDGVLVTNTPQSGGIQVVPYPFMIGDYTQPSSGWEYEGYIDNVALFSTALSDGGVAIGEPAVSGSGIYQLFHQGAISFLGGMIFTNQPASQAVAVGGTATFSAGVSGGTPPYTYQWQLNGTNIGGATAAQLTVTNVQAANAGSYTVIVTDSASHEVLSSAAVLAVGTVGHTLVGLWQLNEGSSQLIYDSSGNGLDGYLANPECSSFTVPVWSANGSPLGAAGGVVRPGNCALYFPTNELNNCAEVNDAPLLDFANAVTLALDFNADNFDQGVLASKYAGGADGSYMLSITPANGDYSFTIINASALRVDLAWPIPLSDAGSYHQLIGTYDGATMRLYHDGVLVATNSQSGGIQVVPVPFMIGDYMGNFGGWEYQGYIDNVAVFSTALSDGGVAVGQAAAANSDIHNYWQLGAVSFIQTNLPPLANPPLTGTMLITNLQITGGQAVLSVSNTTGIRYSVEQATNLPNGWLTIATTQFENTVTSSLPASPRAFWRLQQPVSAGVPPFVSNSWTLVVLPDTQYYSCGNSCSSTPDLFKDQMRWIIANQVRYNIKYVVQLGDIVDSPTSAAEWANAQAALRMLDGLVPYAFVPGNHDYGSTGIASDRTTLLTNYFPVSEYRSWPTFGGTETGASMEDSYHLFSAGGVDWLILALEWGPRSNAVAWANQIVSAYPSRKVILITHAYMYSDNTRYDWAAKGNAQSWSPYTYGTASDPGGTSDGQDLWNNLVSLYPNFVMVISGHALNGGLGRLDSTTGFGNVVHQMLVNYQMDALGGGARMRLVEFLPDGQTEQVTAFSPYYGTWLTDSGNQFVLTNQPPLQ
jgi:hypothetical protein